MFGVIDFSRDILHPDRIKEFDLMNDPTHNVSQERCHDICSDSHIIFHSKDIAVRDKSLYDDIVVVNESRLFNHEELISKLNYTTLTGTASTSITDLIAMSYQKWGQDFVNHIDGEYFIIILNSTTKTIEAYRDPCGMIPVYYHVHHGSFYFSTELRRLAVLKNCQVPDLAYIEQSLHDTPESLQSTFYKPIKRLPPGSRLTFTPNKQPDISSFHNFEIKRLNLPSKNAYLTAFQNHLESAVSKQIENESDVSCHVTGGLDSTGITSIACHLAESKRTNITTYLCGLKDAHLGNNYDVKDDRDFVSAICKNSNIPMPKIMSSDFNKYFEDYGLFKGVPLLYDKSMYLKETCEDILQSKSRVLLSGFGGDQCITFNESPIFLKHAFWKFRWAEAFEDFLAYGYKRTIRAIFFSQSKAWKFPTVTRLLLTKPRKTPNYYSLNPFILKKLGTYRMINRIETEKEYASYYGIEMRYPYLDLQLISFFLSIPSKYKILHHQGRRFYREAIKKWISYEPFVEQAKSRVPTVPSESLVRRVNIDQESNDYKLLLDNLTEELRIRISFKDLPKNPASRIDKSNYTLLCRISTFDKFIKSLKSNN